MTQYVTFPAAIDQSNLDYLSCVRDAATGVTLYTFEHGEYDLDLSFNRPSQSILIPGSDAPFDPFGSAGFPLDKRTITLKWLKRYRVGETHSSNRIAFHRAIADGRQVQIVMLDSAGLEWVGLAKATAVPTKIVGETTFSMDMGITFEMNPPYFRQLHQPGAFYWDTPGVFWDGLVGQLNHVTINTAGSYSVAPTGVTFSGGTLTSGSAATGGVLTTGSGPYTVTGVTILSSGVYSVAPTISFTGGAGTAATATAVLNTVNTGFTFDSNPIPTLGLTAVNQSIVVTNSGDAVDRSGIMTFTGPLSNFDVLVYDSNAIQRHFFSWLPSGGLAAGDKLIVNNATGSVRLNGAPAFDNRFSYHGNEYFGIWPGNTTISVIVYGGGSGQLTVDSKAARY